MNRPYGCSTKPNVGEAISLPPRISSTPRRARRPRRAGSIHLHPAPQLRRIPARAGRVPGPYKAGKNYRFPCRGGTKPNVGEAISLPPRISSMPRRARRPRRAGSMRLHPAPRPSEYPHGPVRCPAPTKPGKSSFPCRGGRFVNRPYGCGAKPSPQWRAGGDAPYEVHRKFIAEAISSLP